MDDITAEIEQDVARLRAELAHPARPPAGLTSRIEASVRATINQDEVGWQPRLVIACIVFAVGAAMTDVGAAAAIALMLVATFYSQTAIRVTDIRASARP
jgi:hypothetical protein